MRSWPGFILAPVLALANLYVLYALVPAVCTLGKAWMLHVTAAFFLLLTLAITIMSWRAFRAARAELLPLVSLWSGAFFSLVVLAQWTAPLFLGPCSH
jgi:hypothetical protein